MLTLTAILQWPGRLLQTVSRWLGCLTSTRRERIGLVGDVLIEHIRDGRVIATRHGHNLTVTAGLAWLAGCMTGDTAAPTGMKYIGIGTDSTVAGTAQTTLLAEVESRATGTQSRTTVTLTNDTYQCVGTITATAQRLLREVGLFSASSDGTMLARQVYALITLEIGDSVTVTWKVTFSAT